MEQYPSQFLDLEPSLSSWEKAKVVIFPFPYEGGVSYGKGASKAPDAVINASRYLELYDEVLEFEPCRAGICTVMPPLVPSDHEDAVSKVYGTARSILEDEKYLVLLGGDHSISSGFFKALSERYKDLAVVQIDAHADLRDTYEGSPFSHACVMSRIRETTSYTLQIGIRSMSLEEAERVKRENLPLCTMHDYRRGCFDLEKALDSLPEKVFLTFDVDAFDWSVVSSTGTPEPGGFSWDEAIGLLQVIFSEKDVVGFDVVELSHSDIDRNSPFAVAKLIYKMIGFRLANQHLGC